MGFSYKTLLTILLFMLAALLVVINYVPQQYLVSFFSDRIEKIAPEQNPRIFQNAMANQTATDWLIFNRIPKCGTKGLRLLFSNLSSSHHFEHVVITNNRWRFSASQLAASVSKIASIKRPFLYTRHMHYIDFNSTAYNNLTTPAYFNIVRDPIDRLVSWFYFQRERPRKRDGLTFDQCVQGNLSECRDPQRISALIPFFCGHEEFCGSLSERSYRQAREHLSVYSIVGYLARMDQFLRALETLWPHYFLGASAVYKEMYASREDVRHKTTTRVEPSTRTREIMRERLAWEYKLYNVITENFDRLYKCLFPKVLRDIQVETAFLGKH